MKFNKITGVIGILISGFIIWYLIEYIDIRVTWYTVRSVSFYYPTIMIGIYLSTFPLRTWRWKLLLKYSPNIEWFSVLNGLIVGFAGNNILPARAGELLRMQYLSKKESLGRVGILTSILVEKIVDAIALASFLFVVSFFFLKEIDSEVVFKQSLFVLLIVLVFTILLVVYFIKKNELILLFVRSYGGKFSSRIDSFLHRIYESLAIVKLDIDGLKVLALSFLIWTMEGLVFVTGIYAVGIHESFFLIGFLTLCIVNFSILIPSSPGYIGVFQAAFIFAFSIFKIDKNAGLAAALLVHACQFLPITLWGILFFFINAFSFKNDK